MKCSYIAAILLLSLICVRADTPKNFDVLKLENGSILEGVLLSEDAYIQIECTGGSFTLPASSVAKVIRSQPGESMILMARHLFQRNQLKRAEHWAKQARVYNNWEAESNELLDDITNKLKEQAEERKAKEKREIERIIKSKGIEAGIKALQQRHNQRDEAEYWGTMRGRLHILLSLERLDHLHLSAAERHLALAEKYGADPKEWNKVKQKLTDMKRMRSLHGRDYLIARFGKKTPPKPKTISGSFLDAVKAAKQRGDKTPPMELLQMVDRYAAENELDPLLVWAVIDTESSWRVNVISHKGAQGLMQLMPGTAKELEVSNPFDAEQNIRGGTQYMRFLLRMFNDVDTALAAYNMGPGRIERAKTMPEAGKRYIQKVKTRYAALRQRFM